MVSFILNLVPFKLKVSTFRHLPDQVMAGEKAVYEIEIINQSGVDQKGLFLYENFFDPRPSFEAFLKKKEPFEERRNAWDRKSLYYRWLWLLYKNKNTFSKPVKLPDLPAGESIRIPLEVSPHFRGYVHFSGITFARPDAFGLFKRLVHIRQPGKLLVLPKPIRVDLPDLVSRRQYHAGGIQLASSIGNSDEFMGLRNYRPGDPLRNIHWKSFAKTNELVIREFEDEFFQRHALILDTDADAENEFLFDAAVGIASYCITTLRTRDSVLDLMFAGEMLYSFSSGRGLGHTRQMLEIIACVEPCGDKEISDMVPVLKENIQQFSGVICVFLNWKAGHKKIFDLFEQAGVQFYIIVLAKDKNKITEKIRSHTKSMDWIHVIEHSHEEKEGADK